MRVRTALRAATCWVYLAAVVHAIPASAQDSTSASIPPEVMQALGVSSAVAQLGVLARKGEIATPEALLLREQVLSRVLLASFDVDEMLGRIEAEAAHASDSRYAIESRKERRSAELNVATFAVSGVLGTAGSAMQLTTSLNHAGAALNVAAGASALSLSLAQLQGHKGDKRVLRSPYNMLAEVLGQAPNAGSRYPALVAAYLHAPAAGDGEMPDGVAPEASLRSNWVRLHRLQAGSGEGGASLRSVTTDPSQGEKLSAEELADREAMLRDLEGAVALLKVELRSVLLAVQTQPAAAACPQ